jgi:hypothetical protein
MSMMNNIGRERAADFWFTAQFDKSHADPEGNERRE